MTRRHLNLMSEQALIRERIRTRLRQWSCASLIMAIILGFLGFFAWLPIHQEILQCADMEVDYEPVRRIKLENIWLKKRIDLLRNQEQFVLALKESFPVLNLLGTVGESVSASHSQVFIDELELEQNSNSHGYKLVSLSLQGIGTNQEAVTQFINSLQTALPFASIRLEEERHSPINQGSVQNFTILCTLHGQ